MRPYLLKALLSIVCLFILHVSKAQPYSITNHATEDSCIAQGNTVSMFLTVNQANPNLSFTTYFGDGTSAPGFMQQTYGMITHIYSLPGTYSVQHVLTLSGVPVDTVQFSITVTLCKYVWVQVYNDVNSNCVLNSTEPLVYTPVKVEIDSAGYKDTITVYGSLGVPLTQGISYTFKMLNIPTGTSATCPTNGIITQTIPTITTPVSVNFGVQCASSAFDLKIHQFKGLYRPVSTSYIHVWASNSSCSPKNGSVTVTFSNKFNYSNAWPTPANVSGNTVTWNFTNMTSSSISYYTIVLTPATTLTLGDTICASAVVTPITGDILTANNSLTQCDSVVSSFDPNEKEVTPTGAILSGTKLTYTLNFENLGNDTAFNIYILDTLSNNLDVNSFEMISSSHAATASVIKGMNGENILRFQLNNIRLPHPASSDQNKGFVRFNINVKPGLPQLTQIPNRAGIYFDINPVVMTNEVTNWIAPISVDEVANNKQHAVYPNPATETVTIKVDKGIYNIVRIMNTVGQLCAQHQLSGNETRIDVSKLVPGIYFLHLSGANGTAVERIEKQ